ncbi:MAG TPA: iron-sulfur cluster assembly protein, partial [Rhodanobacteraceae bacterium]|nr:iron-sulfur cluster assembly protein [Rhodanobacteraceae bacterium]
MSAVTEQHVRDLLAGIVDPHTGVSLAEGGTIHAIGVDGDRVAVEITLGYPAAGWRKAFAAEIKAALEADAGIAQAVVSVTSRVATHKVQGNLMPLPGVKNIIA